MHFVEVLEGGRQLCQHRGRIAEVHPGNVVALERVDEAFGHAVALRAAHRGVDRLEPQRTRHRACVCGNVHCRCR